MSDPSDLGAYLAVRRTRVESALDGYLPRPPACPPIVAEAMRYSLMAGGKRLRPLLALTAAETIDSGARIEITLPAACAIEFIHTYSLVHDDLPAMDDDTLRRGRPTAHVVFGEAVAILAGDALLTEAFHLLAREPGDENGRLAPRKLRTIELIARAAGAEGMVGGQAIDLQASGKPVGGATALQDMHARKTGALIRAAACSGAIMAGADDTALAAVDGYASELGLAFQIVDDILDVEAPSEAIGKTAGKDADANKATYPALFGLDESKRLARECAARARSILEHAGLGGRLPEIAEWVVTRRN